jgi:hypothetical protein
MDVKYNGLPESDQKIVYVREVKVADLPEEVQREAGGLKTLYAVYSPEGERLALVRDRQMAFVLARQNDFAPVTVH